MAQKPLTLTRTPDPQPEGTDRSARITSIADRLEAAANLRISHMDTDSRIASINEQRTATMRELVAELRKLT